MKKAIALALLLVLVAGGVQAQNRGNNKNSRKVPPSMVNSNAPKSIANATTDVRQLPAPVEGMDAPLIFALQCLRHQPPRRGTPRGPLGGQCAGI